MGTKAKKSGKRPAKLRMTAKDFAFMDAFVERNRDAIEAALREAYDSLERGEVYTAGEVRAALVEQRRERRKGRARASRSASR